MFKFEVIEDNAGGIYLFVFGSDGQVIWGDGEFQFHREELMKSIQALKAGDNPSEWDQGASDPQDEYDFCISQGSTNFFVIATEEGLVASDEMGEAGKDIFFG